jgi:hypothetical protein
VDELAEDEEESTQAKLKSRWAALEKVVGAEPRVASVAADLVAHFEERNKAQDGKAMVVTMSRDICVHLYDEIVKLRPDWHDADPEKGAIKIIMTGSASDKALLRPHIYSSQVKKRLEKRFKDPTDPLRLVIVRDMWLTGFDAPCVHTMYVDKPMKGHNLMQAIARVNRVFKDKQGGLVVDYIGIGNELKAAMKEYTASKGRGPGHGGCPRSLSVLLEKLDVLRAMLHGFDYSGFKTGGPQDPGGRGQPCAGPQAGGQGQQARRQDALCRRRPGDEQGLQPVLHAGRGQGGARRGGLHAGGQGHPDQARHQRAEEDRRGARGGHSPDHQPGGGQRRGGGHLRCRGTGKAQHRPAGRRVPDPGEKPARAQSGCGVAGAPAGRRDQVQVRHQRRPTKEVLGPVEQRHHPLPEPQHRDRPGDGRAGGDGQEVQAKRPTVASNWA